jgi:hypothetical protein
MFEHSDAADRRRYLKQIRAAPRIARSRALLHALRLHHAISLLHAPAVHGPWRLRRRTRSLLAATALGAAASGVVRRGGLRA